MKILYVSQYFPPEMGAPAGRVSELASHWVCAGHQVTVLTGFPNHPTGVVPADYRGRLHRLVCHEQVNGVNIVRTWLLPRPNGNSRDRILNYASFWVSSSLTGTFLHRPDVVIATSPQLLVGLTGWWLGQIKRTPFVLEVRDLWPDSLTASEVGTKGSTLIRMLSKLSDFLYRESDHIVVVTPAFKEDLGTNWGIPMGKVSVVENGVETDLFAPNGSADSAKLALGLGGRFVVSYIGTMGLAHGLSTILQAAEKLQEGYPDIVFLIIGEGADKEALEASARRQGLVNVNFLPQRPRDEVPRLIQSSDICLVPLRKADVFKTVIPSKMLEFMACARPVVLGVDGQARQVLEEAHAGIFVEPENSGALVKAITKLYHDVHLREALGHNGRQYIVERLSREWTARMYISVLESVGSNRKRGSPTSSGGVL